MSPSHLLAIDDLGAEGIDEILHLTDTFVEVSARPIARVPALRGKIVAFCFYEDSTRTLVSFETAATGSCPSAPTSSARTCRPGGTRSWTCRSTGSSSARW